MFSEWMLSFWNFPQNAGNSDSEPLKIKYFLREQSDQSHASILNHDVTGSLYYHQSETKIADSNEDELSDSSGNLSVVSEEDFEVSSSSKDTVREDELEIEHDIAFSLTLSLRGPELHLKFPTNSNLKINQSVKTPWHGPSIGVARSYLWAAGSCHYRYRYHCHDHHHYQYHYHYRCRYHYQYH